MMTAKTSQSSRPAYMGDESRKLTAEVTSGRLTTIYLTSVYSKAKRC